MRPLTELGDVRIVRDIGRIHGLGEIKPFITPVEIGIGLGGLALVGAGAALEGKLSTILIGVGSSMLATTIFFAVMSRLREAS